MRTRTFEYKITILDWASIVILLFGDLFCLWHRENSALVVLGVLLIITTLRASDRCLHTKYILTNNELIISTGKFSRKKVIQLISIKSFTTQSLAFRLGHIVVLTTKDDIYISLQPKDKSSFISTLQKRIKTLTNDKNED